MALLLKHVLTTVLFTSGFYFLTCATLAIAQVLAVVVCLSVWSQVGVLLKGLNVGLCKQRHTIANRNSYFCDAKNVGKTQTESPPTEAPNAGGYRLNAGVVAANWQLATFDAKRCQLSSVASLSHWASTLFVSSTFDVMQCVARVC